MTQYDGGQSLAVSGRLRPYLNTDPLKLTVSLTYSITVMDELSQSVWQSLRNRYTVMLEPAVADWLA